MSSNANFIVNTVNFSTYLQYILPDLGVRDISHSPDFSDTSIAFGPIDEGVRVTKLVKLAYSDGRTPDEPKLIYEGVTPPRIDKLYDNQSFQVAHTIIGCAADEVTVELSAQDQEKLRDPKKRKSIIEKLVSKGSFNTSDPLSLLRQGFLLACLPHANFERSATTTLRAALVCFADMRSETACAIIGEVESSILYNKLSLMSAEGSAKVIERYAQAMFNYRDLKRRTAETWLDSINLRDRAKEKRFKVARALYNGMSASTEAGSSMVEGIDFLLRARLGYGPQDKFELLLRGAYFASIAEDGAWEDANNFLERAIQLANSKKVKVAGEKIQILEALLRASATFNNGHFRNVD